jgi:2-methylisocitrate lyase-like PEP mutase family enzyme
VRPGPHDHRRAGGGRVLSATALRALHVPGDPLVLPNAWDAGTARLVAEAGYPAVATTSSGVAVALGYADGQHTPVEEMLAAVARVTRVVEVPVTADMEGGYGLEPEELTRRLSETGAVGLNLEDTDHANYPALLPVDIQAARIAAVKAAGDLVLNARVDVHLRGGETAEALERAAAYRDAGADCLYPIGVADEEVISRFVDLGVPVNVLLRPGAPSIGRLAALGVARVSLGGLLHHAMEDGLRARLNDLRETGQPPR